MDSAMLQQQGATTPTPLSGHPLVSIGSTASSCLSSEVPASLSPSPAPSASYASLQSICDLNAPAHMAAEAVEAEPEEVYITTAEAFAGISLGGMPQHKLRLEREKDEALKHAEEPRRSAQRKTFEEQPSLDTMLKVHKSRLELEKEQAAQTAEEPRRPPSRPAAEAQVSLSDVLSPSKTAMEKAKEEALQRNEPRRSAQRRVFEEQPPLESVLTKHYGRVARDQMAAEAKAKETAGEEVVKPAVPVRRSRLQMEREATARLKVQAEAEKAVHAEAEKAEAAAVASAVAVEEEVQDVAVAEPAAAAASDVDEEEKEDESVVVFSDTVVAEQEEEEVAEPTAEAPADDNEEETAGVAYSDTA